MTGSIQGNRFIGRDAQGTRRTIDSALVHERAEQALVESFPQTGASATHEAAVRARHPGMRPSVVSMPLTRTQRRKASNSPPEGGNPADKRIKREAGVRRSARPPQYIQVRTGPDEDTFVEVGKEVVDLTKPVPVVDLHLNWHKRSFTARGKMTHFPKLDAVYMERSFKNPTQVREDLADPKDTGKLDPAITFEQPWFDPDKANVIFKDFILSAEDAQLDRSPAARDRVRDDLTKEVLADLNATAAGQTAPSANKSYVDTVKLQHVGPGEEILAKNKEQGLFASRDIGEGFQYLGMYAMVQMTDAEFKRFGGERGYSEKEMQSYAMNMSAPREGQTRPPSEEEQMAAVLKQGGHSKKQRGKEEERAEISGTATGGGNKLAFANTATKEATITVTRYKKGQPVKRRMTIKATDDDRINAFFVPMVIPRTRNDVTTLAAGMALIGYNLEPEGPILPDYGPGFVETQLNATPDKAPAEETGVESGVEEVSIKQEPMPDDDDENMLDIDVWEAESGPAGTPAHAGPVAGAASAMPLIGGATEAGGMQPASYDDLLPDQAVRVKLAELTDEQNTVAALLERLAATHDKSITTNMISTLSKHFDPFLKDRGGIVNALTNFRAFARAEQDFFKQLSCPSNRARLIRTAVYALRVVCFPELPSLTAARAALGAPAWAKLNQDLQKEYINAWGNFDVYLACQGKELTTLLGDPAHFINEKQAICRLPSISPKMKGALRLWRQTQFPLPLDRMLVDMIDKMKEMMDGTKESLKKAIPEFAEYACANGLDDAAFIEQVQKNAKLPPDNPLRIEIRTALDRWTNGVATTKVLLDNL